MSQELKLLASGKMETRGSGGVVPFARRSIEHLSLNYSWSSLEMNYWEVLWKYICGSGSGEEQRSLFTGQLLQGDGNVEGGSAVSHHVHMFMLVL